MQKLLDALVRISGLRDREKMNFALVQLTMETELWTVTAARLVRAVGQPGQQRWFTLARLEVGACEPVCDRSWVDNAALPSLAEFPHREAAMVTEAMVRTGSGPLTSVFPIDTHCMVCMPAEAGIRRPLQRPRSRALCGFTKTCKACWITARRTRSPSYSTASPLTAPSTAQRLSSSQTTTRTNRIGGQTTLRAISGWQC